MPDSKALARDFIAALAANDAVSYEHVLAEDATLRLWRWDGCEAYRPRERVVRRLIEEWSSWPDPTLEPHTILAEPGCAAAEFRIYATENQRYIEHNRSAILKIADGQIQTIDLYCAEPVPSARRKGWIAPATMTDDEMRQLFDSYQWVFDIREWVPPHTGGSISSRAFRAGSGSAHPGSNFVGSTNWPADQADAQIEQMIAYHRERAIGFQWTVSSYDAPPDLAERLERQGMVLAGDNLFMARVGLDNLDIPVNPDLTIEALDGSDEQAIEAMIQVVAEGFHYSSEQIDERRSGYFERIQNPAYRERETTYLAWLGGQPAAMATIRYEGGLAFLGGATTLPQYRSRKIYSALLRRRLEDARARGYNVSAIYAGPMSRRVVSRYGFKEYARIAVYAWMPEIDMEVIRSLVPNE